MRERVSKLERDLSKTISVSSNIHNQPDDRINNSERAYDVVCSWCGAVIRSSNSDVPDQMCLICHARMLNDYFQRLRQISDEKRLRKV